MREMSHARNFADVLLNKIKYQILAIRKNQTAWLDSLNVRLAEHLKLLRDFSGINDYRRI